MSKGIIRKGVLLIFVNLIFFSLIASADDGGSSKSGSEFSNNAFTSASESSSDQIKRIGPPGPGGGTGGNPIPVNGGLLILTVGSFIIWSLKIRKQLQDDQGI